MSGILSNNVNDLEMQRLDIDEANIEQLETGGLKM
jgi:hypothetical protein